VSDDVDDIGQVVSLAWLEGLDDPSLDSWLSIVPEELLLELTGRGPCRHELDLRDIARGGSKLKMAFTRALLIRSEDSDPNLWYIPRTRKAICEDDGS
jgi:hypothetical protein